MISRGADATERIVALLSAVGALVAYILAEGWADAAHTGGSSVEVVVAPMTGEVEERLSDADG